MMIIGNPAQCFRAEIGIHKNHPAQTGITDQKHHFQFFRLPGTSLYPGGIFLRRSGNKLLPVLTVFEIPQIRLVNAINQILQLIMIVLPAADPIILLRQKLYHCGFSGVGGSVDKINILKQAFQDVGGYFDFFSFHFLLLFCTTIRAYQISPAFLLSEMTVRDITPESFFFRPHSQRSLLLPYKKVRYIFFSSTFTG